MSFSKDDLVRFVTASSLLELRMMNSDQDLNAHLTYRDVLFMNLIASNPGCTVTWLAEVSCRTKPTVTARINGLVEKGVVIKTRSEVDRRVWHICLSDEVKHIYAEEWKMFGRIADDMGSHFGIECMKDLSEMMNYMSKLMSTYSRDESDDRDR